MYLSRWLLSWNHRMSKFRGAGVPDLRPAVETIQIREFHGFHTRSMPRRKHLDADSGYTQLAGFCLMTYGLGLGPDHGGPR